MLHTQILILANDINLKIVLGTTPSITTSNPSGWTSPLPPAHVGSHNEDDISIHWIVALIFLLVLSSGVIYKICS